MSRSVPYNTGRVQIGVAYVRRPQPGDMTSAELRLQRALIKPGIPQSHYMPRWLALTLAAACLVFVIGCVAIPAGTTITTNHQPRTLCARS